MYCYLTFFWLSALSFFSYNPSFFLCFSGFVITLFFFCACLVLLPSVLILLFCSYWLLCLLPLLIFFYFYFLWLLFFRLCICFVDFSVWFSLLCSRSSYFLFTILGYLFCFFHPLYLWLVFCICFYIIQVNIFFGFLLYIACLAVRVSHVSTCYGAARCTHMAVIAALAFAFAGTRVRITRRWDTCPHVTAIWCHSDRTSRRRRRLRRWFPC